MSDLAQQCEAIRNLRELGQQYGHAGTKYIDTLLAYISELKAEHVEIEEMREALFARGRRVEELKAENEKLKAELAELRRTLQDRDAAMGELRGMLAEQRPELVAQSNEVSAIRERSNTKYICRTVQDAIHDVGVILVALDNCEREKALVGEALRWAIANRCGNARGMFGRETNLHPEPPEHLSAILLQYAGSKP